jgi:hypothetical protein
MAKIVGDIVGKPIEVTVADPAAAGGRGEPGARGGGGPPMAGPPALVTDAVAKLAGRPATSLKAMLEANKAQLIAAAAKK